MQHMMVVSCVSWLCGLCFNLFAEYVITMPNMYARGILFGKMVLELGDTCTAKNEKNGLTCDLEFKTKVFHSPDVSTLLLN